MCGYACSRTPPLSAAKAAAAQAAEDRIEFYTALAKVWFSIGKAYLNLGDAADGERCCKTGWEQFGTALHTYQDKYSHTEPLGTPMTNAEHGGTLRYQGPSLVFGLLLPLVLYDNPSANSGRYQMARVVSAGLFSYIKPPADGKVGLNCIEAPENW